MISSYGSNFSWVVTEVERQCGRAGKHVPYEFRQAHMQEKSKKSKLLKVITDFIQRVKKVIDQKIASGEVNPEKKLLMVPHHTGLKYGKSGFANFSFSRIAAFKESWHTATQQLSKEIKQAPFYRKAKEAISKHIKEDNLDCLLGEFVRRLIERRLCSGKWDRDSEKLVNHFVNDLQTNPIEYKAIIELVKLVVPSKPIAFEISNPSVRIKLSRPSKHYILDRPYFADPFALPSAIGEITCMVTDHWEFAVVEAKLLAILRLYSVGGVQAIRLAKNSYSVRDISLLTFAPLM